MTTENLQLRICEQVVANIEFATDVLRNFVFLADT